MSSITKSFMAYENETDSFLIDNLTVENRLDRISLHGSVEITKDIAGLEHALKLKRVIDASIEALKRDKQLPERIQIPTCL
ncbi:MAG TPA: hypothetical protein PLM93_12075 [Sulfuricurvum sp.]|nr:MAG: hypothetical protein B7Y30_10785 [Campylobacterales bacterium 16-40-21]OZA01822.1 MAG: hypothetical protein B7X89_11815 [Sulfuricurvum sp. 17-40-25]HQS67914.1 hypothetical protein [Sulfuricurvum sp.]HQT37489.1 hypothetical protein [Sulfuricurvum sp.]